MKKLILSLSLFVSIAAIAQDDFTTNVDFSSPVCAPDEILVQVIVGRYCIVRDPILSTCMYWENIYKERCEPKQTSN